LSVGPGVHHPGINCGGVRDLGGQPLAHYIVQAERALFEIEFQEAETGQLLGEIL